MWGWHSSHLYCGARIVMASLCCMYCDAGSNEGKTARLYRRTAGFAAPLLNEPVPVEITNAIDFITDTNRTLREVIEEGETRRWLLYEKTCAGGRRGPSLLT